jgi:hypothetical protein
MACNGCPARDACIDYALAADEREALWVGTCRAEGEGPPRRLRLVWRPRRSRRGAPQLSGNVRLVSLTNTLGEIDVRRARLALSLLLLPLAATACGISGASSSATAAKTAAPSRPRGPSADQIYRGAYEQCKSLVQSVMVAPTTANWPDISDLRQSIKGNQYTFVGKVDAENSFGAMVRSDWHCVIYFDPTSEQFSSKFYGLGVV